MPQPAFHIDGIVPIVPTPFTRDDEVDHESLGALIDFARAAGACAVCLPAYASEFYKLSDEERLAVVATAVAQARGRIPVIAQVNATGVRHVIRGALRAADLGAAAINTAVPRQFAVGEDALFDFFDRILREVRLPVIIQDFNPGGASLSVPFIQRLHQAHPHFRYIKLEEPMLAAKTQAIRHATHDGVGVLEGWGGMYVLDLAPAGIAGVLPSLSLTDLLRRVFLLAREGRRSEALPVFEALLPQIVFSLQNMELYHHAEKSLLAERGVLPHAYVRPLTVRVSEHDGEYMHFLNRRILSLLDELGLPRHPRMC